MTTPQPPNPAFPSDHMNADVVGVRQDTKTTYPANLEGPGVIWLVEVPQLDGSTPVIQGALWTDYEASVGWMGAIGARNPQVPLAIVGALRRMHADGLTAAQAYERARVAYEGTEYRFELATLPDWLDRMARNQDHAPKERPHG